MTLLRYFIFVCMAMFVFVGGCTFVGDEMAVMPRDQRLEAKFHEYVDDFNRLVVMSDEDKKVIRIAQDFTWVSGENKSGVMGKDRPIGFSPERWTEYRLLFEKLGLSNGLTRSENGRLILLTAYSAGLATGGVGKGYMFSRDDQSCHAASLDATESLGTNQFACKRIEGSWYLFLTR